MLFPISEFSRGSSENFAILQNSLYYSLGLLVSESFFTKKSIYSLIVTYSD